MENLMELGSSSNEGDDIDEGPSGERWPPLGAAAVEEEPICCQDHDLQFSNESERLRDLEEQQEVLNSSLIALTTHFAQVQFRLRQIIDAPTQDKELLLQDLEEFAFKGIPEIPDTGYHASLQQDSKDFETAIAAQRMKQKELIGQLKIQLEELENYAYEMGEAGLPQNVIMEKQKVIIDELKGKLNLKVDDFDHLTLDDIRHQVDNAISELVNPLKMKEQLVLQLKTQIVDLERFIEFLQGDDEVWNLPETRNYLKGRTCKCSCPIHSQPAEDGKLAKNYAHCRNANSDSRKTDEIRDKTINMIRRAAALLQIFAVSQFGCGSSIIRLNTLKKSSKIHHWGDLRARLELAVVNVLALAADQESQENYEYSSDSENCTTECNTKITTAVRKQLAISIRDLMQHGLTPADEGNSLVPFMGCFAGRGKDFSTMHAWELILRYYDLKNGPRGMLLCIPGSLSGKAGYVALFPLNPRSCTPYSHWSGGRTVIASEGNIDFLPPPESKLPSWECAPDVREGLTSRRFNSTPVRKLSQSFNLNIVGSKAISSKQNMLGAIGNIINLHTRFKRSYDAQFKAFICAALNSKKLVVWLRLIFRCQPLVETYYKSWSYVAKTGFEDSLQSLDKLTQLKFELPVDLAVHQFQNIKDAF